MHIQKVYMGKAPVLKLCNKVHLKQLCVKEKGPHNFLKQELYRIHKSDVFCLFFLNCRFCFFSSPNLQGIKIDLRSKV